MSAELPAVDDLPAVVTCIRGLPSVAGAPRQGGIHGGSAAIERVRMRVRELARAASPLILVWGEAGAGKRRVAHWLHRHAMHGPLYEIDASTALPPLPAEAGTIVIRHLERAGLQSIRTIRAAVGEVAGRRIILLSRVAPEILQQHSLDHSELIGTTRGARLEILPLRMRPVDIGDIAQDLLRDAAVRLERPSRGLSPGALARLEAYDFPGNVRELRAVLEVATLRATGDWITADAFPMLPDETATVAEEEGELAIRFPGASLREIELRVLETVLRLTGGRVVRAAELLGITRHALRRKLEKHNLGDMRARIPSPKGAKPDGEDVMVPRLHDDSGASYI